MGQLVTRRREMISDSIILPNYELASSTSTKNYNTGWVPFPSTPKDFTVLCEAYSCNYNWSGTGAQGNPGIFCLTSGATFRVGYAGGYNYYENGVKIGSNKTPRTALVFNQASASGTNPQDSDTYKCHWLYARESSSSTYTTKRIGVRFNCSTLKVEGFSAASNNLQLAGNTNMWWNLEHYPDAYSTTSIKLCFNITSNTTCTVNIFRAYDCLLPDAQINAFLQGGA